MTRASAPVAGGAYRGTGLVGIAAAGHAVLLIRQPGVVMHQYLAMPASVVALAVLLVEAGHSQPVAFRSAGSRAEADCAGVSVAAVTGAER